MTREVRQRVSQRQITTPVSKPQTATVHARYVDTFEQPARNHEVDGLISGLASFNPKLQSYLNASDEVDIEAGAAARTKGEKRDDTKSEAWIRGYMRMDGSVKGIADREKVAEKFATGFDIDSGTPEQLDAFIAQTTKELAGGQQDEAFASGYNNALAPSLLKLREQYAEHHRKKTIDTRDQNGMFLIERGVREFLDKGLPVSDAWIDTARKSLSATGVSGKDFNSLLFTAVKRIGDEGNFAVYDMFKRDRPDGTKGMYFIPAWKEKIDQAQIHAQNVYLANQKKAEETAKRIREERQETALYGVFSALLSGDADGARTQFDDLKRKGLFTRASDIVKWEKMFGEVQSREARPDELALQNELLTDIYKGTAQVSNIIEAKLQPRQKRELLSEWYRVKNDARTLAAARERDGAAIYRSREFTSSEEAIKDMLRPTPNATDFFGVGTDFERGQRATALLEFTQRAAKVKDPGELHAIREEIIDRYTKRKKDWGRDTSKQSAPGAPRLRYSTPQEAAAAARKGLIGPDELELHVRFFAPNGIPPAHPTPY